MEFIISQLDEIRVGMDGKRVVLQSSKGITMKVPWQVVETLCKAMIAKSKQIEEMANLDRLLADQAMMFRSGAPFGLSNRRDILKEAAHIAQHDDKLRKYMPGGVKSTALVGTPTVIKHDPPKEVSDEL